MGETSTGRAWLALWYFAVARQFRAGQLLWLSLAMLVAGLVQIAQINSRGGFQQAARPARSMPGLTLGQYTVALHGNTAGLQPPLAIGVQSAVLSAAGAWQAQSQFAFFSGWMVFAYYVAFLMPVWAMCFATNAIGGEREGKTLIWLQTRPLPRWAVYLALFLAALPWAVGLNLLGLAALCLAAGEPGWRAFAAYWPAALAGSLAFSALFCLFGALFRWPAVVGMLYAFVFEVIAGDLPGGLKRFSIVYYVRSLMFYQAEAAGFTPTQLSVYAPAPAWFAWSVLLVTTVLLVLLGMWLFTRLEYRDADN